MVIASRKAEACEEVADGIRTAGGDAHVIPCNISRRAEVEALIAGTTEHYGKIDVLVCNAAVNPYYGPLLDIPDEAFDKIMGSNVKSNIWLCALAIPQMAARGKGSVIIISSIGGLRGSTVIGAYGISKAADFALCRSLAREGGPPGVRSGGGPAAGRRRWPRRDPLRRLRGANKRARTRRRSALQRFQPRHEGSAEP